LNSRFKLFSDPVHGFISVPKGLVMGLVQRPEVQRLRRIRQLGVGHLVFPGAEHTRFNHALGAMALMQDALSSLAEKGTRVLREEHTAALVAALLHDVGHGPFSHSLEHTLIRDFEHEAMSRAILVHLRDELGGGPLALALRMFDDEYERPFFHQLVSSQLDMDRLDYLRRDAFFTGVAEGEVGVERIIKTLRVHPPEDAGRVVVEAKSIYAVENFIIARRLMYWQVYLHKTVLAGDQVLRAAFRRARWHLRHGRSEPLEGVSPDLLFFLNNDIRGDQVVDPEVRERFCRLDDTDVLFTLKQWLHSSDAILADLARRFVHRDFFRVTFLDEPASKENLEAWRSRVADWLAREGLSPGKEQAREDAEFYVRSARSRHSAYQRSREAIGILERDGSVRELSDTADTANVAEVAESVVKPYVFYPKGVELEIDGVA
jgi:HD superfamily phosphohydrolase